MFFYCYTTAVTMTLLQMVCTHYNVLHGKYYKLRLCMKCKFILLVEGRVTTPLPDVSPVCDGGQLELNCTITGSILQWRIIPDQNHSQLST